MIDFTRAALFFRSNHRQLPKLATEGIVLGETTEGAQVRLPSPQTERASHAAVLAASGAGKTVMVAAALVDEYLQSLISGGDSEALVIVDPKGDLVSAVFAALSANALRTLDNVTYLNPFSIDAAAPALLRVLLTNTPTKVIGRLAVGDAELLAKEQAPKPGSDESLSAVRSRLVSSITNLADRQFFLLQPGGRVRFVSRNVDNLDPTLAPAVGVHVVDTTSEEFLRFVSSIPAYSDAEVIRVAGEFGRRASTLGIDVDNAGETCRALGGSWQRIESPGADQDSVIAYLSKETRARFLICSTDAPSASAVIMWFSHALLHLQHLHGPSGTRRAVALTIAQIRAMPERKRLAMDDAVELFCSTFVRAASIRKPGATT